MNVLSLFDGMSCGQIALNVAGIEYDSYHASEIESAAIKVTQRNYPNTIQVGSVCDVKAVDLPVIDLLMGGSPCQGFSNAGGRLNFDDPRSKLFFEYVRILNEIRAINPDVKFLLENVKMKKEWQEVITEYLGVQPILINSSLVSAQNRERLYWTNIEGAAELPEDRGILLRDILTDDYDPEQYKHTPKALAYMDRQIHDGRNHWDFRLHSDTGNNKSACLVANLYKGVPFNVLIDRRVRQISESKESHGQQPYMQNRIYDANGLSPALTSFAGRTNVYDGAVVRKLTPVECERLQTVPDGYTAGISNTQRYKMLGNGWTVEVIAHILRNLKTNTNDKDLLQHDSPNRRYAEEGSFECCNSGAGDHADIYELAEAF